MMKGYNPFNHPNCRCSIRPVDNAMTKEQFYQEAIRHALDVLERGRIDMAREILSRALERAKEKTI